MTASEFFETVAAFTVTGGALSFWWFLRVLKSTTANKTEDNYYHKRQEMTDIHPAPTEFTDAEIQSEPILRFFHYAHLPPSLQSKSKPFCNLARVLFNTLPKNAERATALRKLLEAKDCAVRAGL